MSKCRFCGKKALEAVEFCSECLQKASIDPGQIKKLKQINDILSLMEIDTNTKSCVESLIEIKEDLERYSNGKEEKKS